MPKPEVPQIDEAKATAAILGLAGFAASIFSGLYAGNSGSAALSNAVLALCACALIGWLIGEVLRATVRAHMKSYKQSRPVPRLGIIMDAQSTPEASAVENTKKL